MAITKRAVQRTCKATGVTIEDAPMFGMDDPPIELVAPDGKHFDECGGALHTLLCIDWDDAMTRLECYPLTDCTPDCE